MNSRGFVIVGLALLAIGLMFNRNGVKNAVNTLFPASFEANTCLVKWQDAKTRENFTKGLGKDFTQRLNEGIIVRFWDNQLIFVQKKTDGGNYVIKFWNTEYIQGFVDDALVNVYEPSDELKQSLMFQSWKVRPGTLTSLSEGYEKVDCETYRNGTHL